MENQLKTLTTKNGTYLGLFLIACTVIAYSINLELFLKPWFGIVLFFFVLGFGIYSTMGYKKQLNGFISFKQGFSSFILPIIIGMLLSSVVSFLLFNFIDTEAATFLKEKTIEMTVNMMEGFGAPEASINEAVTKLENQNQFGIAGILKSLAFQIVFYAVVGLIVALSFKKKDPNLE